MTLRAPLTVATLLATASLAAQAQARPMTPEDVAKIEAVGTIAVSPDGSRVAYTTARLPDVTDGEENGSTTQQLSMAYGPGNVREFLPADMNVRGLEFSPDGRMVSFLWADEDEKMAVWGIPVDGGAQRKLAHVKDAAVRSYAWAPDGSHMHLLVAAEEDKDRTKQDKAGFNSVVYEEEEQFNRLFRARIGTEPDAEPQQVEVPGYVTSFQIADNARIGVIETAPTTQIDDQYVNKKVNILDMATGDVRMVIDTPGKIDDVEISPDASQLALIAAVDMNDPAATTIHFVDTATGTITPHNAGAPEAVVDVEYMDDGRLVAAVHVGAQSVLRIHNADGSLEREIDPGALIAQPETGVTKRDGH